MEINENHLKINESQSKPRVAPAGIAKPSNKKTESCVVFKYVFFQMAQIAWNVCKDLNAKPLETARRGEMRNGGSGTSASCAPLCTTSMQTPSTGRLCKAVVSSVAC